MSSTLKAGPGVAKFRRRKAVNAVALTLSLAACRWRC